MRRKKAIVFAVFVISFSAITGTVIFQRSEGFSTVFDVCVTGVMTGVGFLVLARELVGTEIIEWDSFVLRVSDTLFGFRRNREFDIGLIRNVRFGSSAYWQGNTYVMSAGRIQFDYGGKMISMGGNVTEDEAFAIVERIRNQQTEEKARAPR